MYFTPFLMRLIQTAD